MSAPEISDGSPLTSKLGYQDGSDSKVGAMPTARAAAADAVEPVSAPVSSKADIAIAVKRLEQSVWDSRALPLKADIREVLSVLEYHHEVVNALAGARSQMARIIGDHHAPNDCYATGPLTGDPYTDLVSCPSCEGERMLERIDALLAQARGEQS